MKTKAQAKYVGCLCEYCENLQLKIEAINHVKPGTFKDLYELSHSTMCAKPTGWAYHRPECITRTCGKCGVHLIDVKLAPLLDTSGIVEWKRWEMVVTTCYTNKVAKQVKKRKPLMKSGTISDLVQQLKEESEPFAEHLFNKDWQNRQEKVLKEKLGPTEVLGIFDFAENVKCENQREVQSAYYSHDSATVHPIVAYYKCTECLEPVTESCVMISNDLTHDYHLVNTFQETTTKHLRDTRGLALSTFYRFSDGCSSQYKSKGPISDIRRHLPQFLWHKTWEGSQ